MATILSGVGAYANSQTQTLNTLKAITNLKENQITLLVDEIRNDADKIQGDFRFKQNVMAIFTQGEVDPEQNTSYQALARSYLWSIQRDKVTYSEIMVLDSQGVVILSTNPEREGENYETQLFYRQGTVKFFTGFANIPDFGNQNLIVATPFFDTNGQIIRGVIVLRSDASAIKKIMESTPGFEEAETYLVNKNFNPVTKTHTQTQTVRSKGALNAVIDNIDGQGNYDNYANEAVLGYYKWYEPMQMAVIAEVPVSLVVTSSFSSLAGSTLLSLFAIAFAITAVVISARSIADPIKDLAQITESYAVGKFSSRANVDRKDEIGALAKSYNQMVAQLQDIISKLEQRGPHTGTKSNRVRRQKSRGMRHQPGTLVNCWIVRQN
jgi:HAMP domain-containing protein